MRRVSNPERGAYTASPSSTSRVSTRRATQVPLPLRATSRQSLDATAYLNLTSGGGSRSTDHRASVASSLADDAPSVASLRDVGDANDRRIQVCVRVRPLLLPGCEGSKGKGKGEHTVAWAWQDGRVITQTVFSAWEAKSLYRQAGGRGQVTYAFDHLFTPDHSTTHIYQQVLVELVRGSLNGINASVFAYGQTATGKTYTLQGTPECPGVIPLAIHDLFDHIQRASSSSSQPQNEASQASKEASSNEAGTGSEGSGSGGGTSEGGCSGSVFSVKVAYLEIYNEQIHDLLCPSTPSSRIHLLDDTFNKDGGKGMTVKGIREETVHSPQEALALIAAGEASRHMGATDLNANSSRSHTICRLTVHAHTPHRDGGVGVVRRVGVLSLVDLAGSENAKLTNATGGRQKEGQYINKSLLALGHVIQKLSSAPSTASLSAQHIPFRDSKLTRFLQPSLEGKGLVAIICSISPAVACLDESHNTLKFATRAKRIRVRADVNQVLDDATQLARYREEVSFLRTELAKARRDSHQRLATGNGPVLVLSESHAASLRYVAHNLALCRPSPSPPHLPPTEDDLPPAIPLANTNTNTTANASANASSAVGLEGVYQHYLATLTAIGIPALPPPPPTPPSPSPSSVSTSVSPWAHPPSHGPMPMPMPMPPGNGNGTLLNTQLRDLRSRLEQKEVTANLISADRHFLQQLLLEREELLQQVAQVVEEVDDKQRFLDWELGCLREENDALLTELSTYRDTYGDTYREGGTQAQAQEEEGEDEFLMLIEEGGEEEGGLGLELDGSEEGAKGLCENGSEGAGEDEELSRIADEGMPAGTADREGGAVGGRIASRAF